MSIEIKAPQFPESVADGTIATWHRKVGEACQRDDLLVDIETDKVVLEVVAPADGVLTSIIKDEGDTVLSEELLAEFEAGGEATADASSSGSDKEGGQGESETAADSAAAEKTGDADIAPMSPAARKLATEKGVDPAVIDGTGKDGRITKEDVQRASVARRLVEAQQTAAMLTTFNEVDMRAVMTLRSRHKEAFEKAHNGTRLGFMSFFVRAACEALKRFPAVNASIDGTEIVYHGFYDVGVAVSTERGLVVPVIRDADGLGLAQIEDAIRDFGLRARDGKLSLQDMTGGTFTISNGGVFGSLLSTPILNPPQTAILGMHKIQDRPMVVDGEIMAVPMMYLALSYDHRLIDGSEAVRFLVAIKDLIEDPARMLLDI